MEIKELKKLPYRELQKLAKDNNIKANQKKKDLIRKLSSKRKEPKENTGKEENEKKQSEETKISVFETIYGIKRNLAILGIIGILIIVAFVGLTYSSGGIEAGDEVNIEYSLFNEDEEFIETGNITFTVGEGEVIKGFDEGVIGLTKGETKIIEVPPEEGYGEYDPVNINAINEEETIPRTDVAPLSVLETLTNDEIKTGAKIKIRTLPWPISIYSIDEIEQDGTEIQEVTYKHEPVEGSLYTDTLILPWKIKVTTLNETAVVYKNMPNIGAEVVSNNRVGRVTKIEDGYVVIDFNHELAGKTLTFRITVLDINK